MKKIVLSLAMISFSVYASAQAQQNTQQQPRTYPIVCKPDSAIVSIMNWDLETHTKTEIHDNAFYIVETFKVVTENANGRIDTSGLQEGAHKFFDKKGKELILHKNEIISVTLVPPSKK